MTLVLSDHPPPPLFRVCTLFSHHLPLLVLPTDAEAAAGAGVQPEDERTHCSQREGDVSPRAVEHRLLRHQGPQQPLLLGA